MSFLDFIKNRNTPERAQTPAKSETIHQATAREAEQNQHPKLQDAMPPDQLAKASKVERAGISGGQDVTSTNVSPSPTPPGGATNPQPMRQMSMQQDNPAPALSPTSAQKGTSVEKDAPLSSSAPKPTLPRATPSWER